MRWNALPLASLWIVLGTWGPQAEAAQDLVPLNGPGHIRVAPPNEEPAIFYPVDPGAELQYAFTGPGKVVIWVRSTRPPDQPWIYGPYLQMPFKADGWSLVELVLRPRLTPMGTVDGEGTPFPPLATAMQVDVTGPCSSLGVMAPGNGPSLLVRVVEVLDALLELHHVLSVGIQLCLDAGKTVLKVRALRSDSAVQATHREDVRRSSAGLTLVTLRQVAYRCGPLRCLRTCRR